MFVGSALTEVIKHTILKKRKIQELKHSLELSKEDRDRELTKSVQVAKVIQYVQEDLAQLIHMFEKKQIAADNLGD